MHIYVVHCCFNYISVQGQQIYALYMFVFMHANIKVNQTARLACKNYF